MSFLKLFSRVGAVPFVEGRLALLGEKESSEIVFSDVHPSGWGFVVALIANAVKGPLVVVCDDVRGQEELAFDLEVWGVEAEVFPEVEVPVSDAVLPDEEVMAERFDLARRMQEGTFAGVLVLTRALLEDEIPSVASGDLASLKLQVGVERDPELLVEELVSWGYERVEQVYGRGQFARRGGVLDVFSWHHALPVRVEFFDLEVESLRIFDPDRQVSVRAVEECEFLRAGGGERLVPMRECLEGFCAVRVGDDNGDALPVWIHAGAGEGAADWGIFPTPTAGFGAGDFVLDELRRGQFFEELAEWQRDGWRVVFFSNNEGEWERFRELAGENGADLKGVVSVEGGLSRGFVVPSARVAVLCDAELFGRTTNQRLRRLVKRREGLIAARANSDFTEFEEDDFVVHDEHGVGRFLGLQNLKDRDGEREVMVIEFAEEAKLYVDLEDAWQVARYVGMGKRRPDLSKLGDGRWAKAKGRVKRSIFEYAQGMLSLQAERDTAVGVACAADSHWQREFEASFLFTETEDQLRAISESKGDMESVRPMDRLICGDVGFGKTEVAIRAAFKAVDSGRQVVFLAPTTVLAQQHFETLRERMSDYPMVVELLNRYRTRGEQRRVLEGLRSGGVDIVVGTHRLVSPDVEFKNLGLVIVDEEQRFGVKHKDILKERFRLVDVLTLSATPIPRTLYMALMGARDMSLIETPPPNRKPVETVICGYDERVIRDAVQRELDRGGQVYLLHNRVRTIEKLAGRVRELCPGARVDVGHGQMAQGELEGVMKRFVEGRTDVLVSTTIIESGLDIPNANTIIIDRADMFGLADLYQLRGRVGRSGVKAFAYLMIPRSLVSVGSARKRISAIKQYSQLGAGFKIAMRDLEIRGAGNILGTAQSGNIISIGFDLYCKMLRRAVRTLQGERDVLRVPAGLDLDFLVESEGEFVTHGGDCVAAAFLPVSLVRGSKLRMDAFRHLNEVVNREELEKLRGEWVDRFGRLPMSVENLILCMRIRMEASRRRVTKVAVREGKLMLTRRGDFLLISGKFPRLIEMDGNKRLREVAEFVEALEV
ncbi:MAG: transcription-repair coupling factor [Chthoniobacterales bacterium]